MIVEVFGNHGLAALIHVNVAHRLFARLMQLRQRLYRRAAVALGPQCKPPISLASIDIVAHVHRGAPRELCECGAYRK